MFGLPPDQVIPIAQIIGIGILGILAAFGTWWGRGRKTPGEKTIEVAGALVDSASLKLLAGAIEGQTMEMMQARKQAEKGLEALDKMTDCLCDLEREVGGFRNDIRDLATQIARKR